MALFRGDGAGEGGVGSGEVIGLVSNDEIVAAAGEHTSGDVDGAGYLGFMASTADALGADGRRSWNETRAEQLHDLHEAQAKAAVTGQVVADTASDLADAESAYEEFDTDDADQKFPLLRRLPARFYWPAIGFVMFAIEMPINAIAMRVMEFPDSMTYLMAAGISALSLGVAHIAGHAAQEAVATKQKPKAVAALVAAPAVAMAATFGLLWAVAALRGDYLAEVGSSGSMLEVLAISAAAVLAGTAASYFHASIHADEHDRLRSDLDEARDNHEDTTNEHSEALAQVADAHEQVALAAENAIANATVTPHMTTAKGHLYSAHRPDGDHTITVNEPDWVTSARNDADTHRTAAETIRDHLTTTPNSDSDSDEDSQLALFPINHAA
ncbi:MAG: hypothetical protein GY791_11745 [Alphaproteobacteria bacterium]|nr:hypothetical protein [Alphaproteobacteria bacterium]